MDGARKSKGTGIVEEQANKHLQHNNGETRADLLERVGKILQMHMWNLHKHNQFAMERLGLTRPQAMILLMLKMHNGQCAMQQIATLLQQSGATVTGIVDRLVGMGLVKREHATQDRRVVFVTLTPEGHAQLERIEAQAQQTLTHATSDFTNDELEQLTTLMFKLLQGLKTAMQDEHL